MKTTFCLLIFLGIFFNAYSQDYDLIITAKGDSIACYIDSISDASIYFEMKHNNHWVHTNINKDDIIEYKYDAVDKKLVAFKTGTSYIHMVYNNANLMKALKLQKSGKTVAIVGGSILGATIISVVIYHEDWGLGAIGVGLIGGSAGLATMVVGMVLNETGKYRVERIISNMNTSFNSITFELKPCAQYNLVSQNYQPGLTLRIRF